MRHEHPPLLSLSLPAGRGDGLTTRRGAVLATIRRLASAEFL
ncbi:MAG TPA: hypothetical protein PK372_05575 [Rugosibacter sp.]|nr:hypothetical protein [Rugosibacter sp.]HQQ35381.1 hypothetical protein [Rugosibacter sp.]